MTGILLKLYSSPFIVRTIATSIFFFYGSISWIQGATFNYNATITLCTGTCDQFVSTDVGSTIAGTFDIDVGPSSSFGDAEINNFQFTIFNPALPENGPVGDPENDNPLIIDSALGVAASNGSSGTTDATGKLNGGQLLLEFLTPPFSENGAYIIIDLATGNGQICLFYATAGCIPGATEALKFEGAFTGTVPVKFSSINGRQNEDNIEVNWTTESEINNSHFVLERSEEGTSWNTIEKVTALGTTTETKNYIALDKAPLKNENYYRVKQVDYDGQYSYSHQIVVQFVQKGKIRMYPNPTFNFVYIDYSEVQDNVIFEIFDINGKKKILTVEKHNFNYSIDLSNFQTGIYFIRMIDKDDTVIYLQRIEKLN